MLVDECDVKVDISDEMEQEASKHQTSGNQLERRLRPVGGRPAPIKMRRSRRRSYGIIYSRISAILKMAVFD